jgi:succinate dehydrogenase assembly factor 1
MRSGLQTKVLSLYRDFQRVARQKPASTRPRFIAAVRAGFRQHQTAISPRDVTTIEYFLRRGETQLEQLRSPDVTDIEHKTGT